MPPQKEQAPVILTGDSLSKKSVLPAKRAFKSVFCLSSAEAKNTSISASVRIDGKAVKTCAQLRCSSEKSL